MSIKGYSDRLDSIARAIKSHESKLKSLEESHAKALNAIDQKFHSQTQSLTTAKDHEVSQAKEEQRRRDAEISAYLQQVDAFDALIPQRLRKGVSIDSSSVTPKDCNWNDMDAMSQKILDDTLWAKVKGVLSVDGFYSRKAMVGDYLTHIAEARALAEQEKIAAKENCRIAEQGALQRMNASVKGADDNRRRAIQNENASYARQKQAEESDLFKAADQSKFKPIGSAIKSGFSGLLRNLSGLANVALPKREANEILLGEASYEFDCGQQYKDAAEVGLHPFCKYPFVKLPLSASTHGSYSMIIEVSSRHRDKAFDGVRSIMARSIAAYPFEGIEISYIDPIDRGTNLERFQRLSISDECSALRPPLASEDDIEREMTRLEKAVDALSIQLATIGTLDDHNSKSSARIPHRLIVVNDFPAGFNRKALEAFNVLFNNRAKCGISFIVTHQKEHKPEREAESLYKRIERDSLLVGEGRKGFEVIRSSGRMRLSFTPSRNIPDQFFDKICSQYEAGKVVDNGFARICDFKHKIAFDDSTDGLFIPFAVNRYNEIIDLELGTASAAHMVITGSTGSGKSTTLHAIIAGIMLKYHSKDVEIWLVDYKETEFAEYLLNKFPSIKLIGLDKSKEFTYALVDMISEEMEKRASFFASEHVQDLSAYKRKHGSRSYPRIVIIIDEFHNLAQTIKDDPEYVTKFENILSECRSAGMSCVFSDQSIMEGLRGLTEKGKKQLTSRIAMRNSTDEIRGTLDLDSSYYTDELKGKIRALGKGDVVMKREKVSADGYDVTVEVDKYKSIFVKQEDRGRLSSYIASNTTDCPDFDPMVVNGQKRARFSKAAIQELESKSEAPRSGETYLYLGTPSNFDPCFRILLTKQLGQNVAILGQETDRRMSVVLYAIRSFTRSKDAQAYVFAHPEDPLYEQYRGLFRRIAGQRISVYDDVPEICEAVSRLSKQIEDGERKKTLVTLLGYELLCDEFELLPPKPDNAGSSNAKSSSTSAMNSIDEMLARYGLADNDDEDASNNTDESNCDDSAGYDARGDFGDLVTKGCRYGIHVVMSLEKSKAFRKIRTFNLDSFDHKIALPISLDESLEFFGTSQAAKGIDQISAAYSDSGSAVQIFRPYLIPKPKTRKG